MRMIFSILTIFAASISVNAQSVLPSKSSFDMHKRIKLAIEAEKLGYIEGEDIQIHYEFLNISDTVQRILYKKEWPHLMGLTASIFNDNNVSICKYSTKAVFSSQIYSEDELVDYHRFLKPGESIKGEAILQDIPVFKDEIIDDKIPPGKYSISLSFFQVFSNTIEIKIGKNKRP